ncbi:MAG: hypothetical protein LBP98_02695 [Tannerella sp.]|jgi:hypothetical protein|nr:hypothetical protein [Tannerella sp.]
MSTNNRTEHLDLPLPHQDNLLEDDVQRLRESLTELDAHADQTDTLLAAKADAAATAAALATKVDASAMETALAGKSDAQSTQAAISSHAAKSAVSEVGHVRLATDAEAAAGEITDKAVNPKQIKAAADAVTAAVTDTSREEHAASYKSSGSSAANTGFKLLNDADIGTLFGKIDNVTLASSGSGNFIGSIGVAINGKTAQITQNKIGPTYCSHCGYCSYCTYCSHPATNNANQSSYSTTVATYSLEGGGSSTFTLRRTNCNCNCNCGG